jgi:predicted TIM-barrel fold metal-dependent hydrolase
MGDPVIDIHIHFGAPEDQASGCYWSEDFAKSPAYFAMLLITHSLFKRVNLGKIKKHMFEILDKSKYTGKGVFLALDKVYDKEGNPHDEKTHLYVPNRYIIQLASENSKVLFGASVHPYRSDWEDELDYCLMNKAVLCKWIPSAQLINPSKALCIPFYRKLALHNLPLLCHSGPEYSIPTSDPIYTVYNNPRYLRSALDNGVTVIIAHCATPYWGSLDVDYQDDFKDFLKLFHEADIRGWKIYADLSAVCTPFRSPYIEKVLGEIPSSRLIYASDYPIPISDICFKKSKKFFFWLGSLAKTMFMENLLDKNYMLIKQMGFDNNVFSNAAKLIRAIKYP